MLLAFVSIVFIVSFSFIADHPKLRIFFGLSLLQWNFHFITPLQGFWALYSSGYQLLSAVLAALFLLIAKDTRQLHFFKSKLSLSDIF